MVEKNSGSVSQAECKRDEDSGERCSHGERARVRSQVGPTWLQDDAWWPALSDLLHRLAFTGFLDGIHHLKRTGATLKWKTGSKMDKCGIGHRSFIGTRLTSSSYGKPLVSILEKSSWPLSSISKLPVRGEIMVRLGSSCVLNLTRFDGMADWNIHPPIHTQATVQ